MNVDLRTFINKVKELGPEFYMEAGKEVKPQYETWMIQHKLDKQGRFPVVYYPKVEGSSIPVVTNVFGSWKLFGLAVDMDPRTASVSDIFHEYRRREENRIPFKTIAAAGAPVREVVLTGKDASLDVLPIMHHAPLDSGKFITCGQLVCKDPKTGVFNVGIYRMEVKGKQQLKLQMLPVRHPVYIMRRWEELGKPMEVAVYIGHHPLVTVGAEYTGSMDVCEYDVVGGYLGEPLEVVPAATVDLAVPANAEIVIEGVVNPSKRDKDGPLAEWSGFYGEEADCFVLDVTAITMRRDAIYQDLTDGCREHPMLNTIGFTAAVYDAVARVVPSVKNVYMPLSGRGVITAYISIPQRVSGEARRAGLAAINSAGPVKIAVIVDEEIDVYNEEEVQWAIATRVRPEVDIQIIPNIAGERLDPTSYDESGLNRGHMTTKWIIDATKPMDSPFPTRITAPQDLLDRIDLTEYLKNYQ